MKAVEEVEAYASGGMADTLCKLTGEAERDLYELAQGWYKLALSLAERVDSLQAFKRSVDEALNSGDGSYRP